MDFALQCLRGPDGSVEVVVSGVLDEVGARQLAEQVDKELDGEATRFILDLRKVRDCKVLGRSVLREVQNKLTRRRARTAYITDSPRMRGMTFIVINGSGDGNANTFIDPNGARAWVASDEDRRALNLAQTEKNG